MTASYAEGKRVGELRRPAGRRTASRDRAAIIEALNDLGYEPGPEDPSTVRLCNCPFRSVADIAPDLICGMNHQLVRGLLDGLGLDAAGAVLAPAPPNCCLTVAVPQ
jgi:predicted ArsR family transcriptional regulator